MFDPRSQDDWHSLEPLPRPRWSSLIALLVVLPLYAGILGGVAAMVSLLTTLTEQGALLAVFGLPFAIIITFVFGGPLMAVAWLLIHVLSARSTRRFAQALALVGGAFGLYFGFSMLNIIEDGFWAPLLIMPAAGAAIGWHTGNILGNCYEP